VISEAEVKRPDDEYAQEDTDDGANGNIRGVKRVALTEVTSVCCAEETCNSGGNIVVRMPGVCGPA
jgi:hypothetical protein